MSTGNSGNSGSFKWPKPERTKKLNVKYLFMVAADAQINQRMSTVAESLIAGDELPMMLRRIDGMIIADDGLQIDATLREPNMLFDLRCSFIKKLAQVIEAEFADVIVTTDRHSLTVTKIKEFNGYRPERERAEYTNFNKTKSGRPRAGAVVVTVED